MKRALGIDIGGTTIKGGIVEVEGGARVAEGFVHFDKKIPASAIWGRVAELVERLEDEAGTRFPRIGVGCAGLFDRATGEVLASANMPNLE
ncbi:MAG: ROK family protein, partial [Planctomycetota bacterium]